VVLDPSSNEFLHYRDGPFVKYHPIASVNELAHLNKCLMSTEENLPVYLIESF
jgi:hypothetical protein